MPKLSADELHAETVERLLRANRALAHVRLRKRGDAITLESGPKDDPVAHARLRRVTAQWSTLEMPTHARRWERTPLRAPLSQVVTTLISEYPWTLTQLAADER